VLHRFARHDESDRVGERVEKPGERRFEGEADGGPIDRVDLVEAGATAAIFDSCQAGPSLKGQSLAPLSSLNWNRPSGSLTATRPRWPCVTGSAGFQPCSL